MKTAVVYRQDTHHRSEVVCASALYGLQKAGYDARIEREALYAGCVDTDIAVFYGMAGNLRQIFNDYRTTPGHHALYFDLPYWRREGRYPNFGHHKLVVDARHPTSYFQNVKHTLDRWRTFGVRFYPRVTMRNAPILVAGMSKKACDFEGYEHEAFERDAISRIKAVTRRPIVYRPKPGCPHSKPLPGVQFHDPRGTEWGILTRCHAVVARHSNVAVDGLCAGSAPCVIDGVATLFSTPLEEIETPRWPSDADRCQFLADLAYTQWSLEEIRSGRPFTHLASEGII